MAMDTRQKRSVIEMDRAANGPVFGRAAEDILAVGFHRAATSRPLMLKKSLKFYELTEPLGGN